MIRAVDTGTDSLSFNYFFSALAGDYLVFPVFLLHDGRNADGPLQVFKLDAAHGKHNDVRARLWGIALKEWRGVGVRTKVLVGMSLFVLVASTVVVGYGNYLGTRSTSANTTAY